MVIGQGCVTDISQPDLTTLLRDILQQQTAMLQVQAESVRLQRVLVERLLGVSVPQSEQTEGAPIEPTISTGLQRTDLPAPTGRSAASAPVTPPDTIEPARIEANIEQALAPTPEKTE